MPELEKPCILSSATPGNRYPRRIVGSRKDGTRRMKYESRIVLERKLGRPIRPGYVARHLCFTSRCVESTHIVEGTQSENMLDDDVLWTGTREFYSCSHPRSPENGRWAKRPTLKAGGQWQCRICHNARSKRWRLSGEVAAE